MCSYFTCPIKINHPQMIPTWDLFLYCDSFPLFVLSIFMATRWVSMGKRATTRINIVLFILRHYLQPNTTYSRTSVICPPIYQGPYSLTFLSLEFFLEISSLLRMILRIRIFKIWNFFIFATISSYFKREIMGAKF